MKKRLWQLLLGFIACYYIVHVAYDLPDLLHGLSAWNRVRGKKLSLLWLIVDMGATFLFPLVAYLALFYFYPKGKMLPGLLLLPASLMLVFYVNHQLSLMAAVKPFLLRSYFRNNLFFFVVYTVYGIVFYFIRYSHHKQLEQKELIIQQRQSELSFLHSQINPHFLFNSLNNIYALVYEGSAQALPAIAGLSDLLRYMLYNNKEKVLLQEEWAYVQKYIHLQVLRYEQPIHTNLHISGSTNDVYVPPLLLIPFVENAFKHGDFSVAGQGLQLVLHNSPGKMHFYCFNKKGSGHKDAGGGIGLTNVKRRLELLYPGKHTLEINETDHSFTVNLELLHDEQPADTLHSSGR